MDKVLQQIAQNVHIKNKLNEANHDYQTLRRRAVLRRNNRLKHKLTESYAIEKKLLNDVGVESYRGESFSMETVFHVMFSLMLVAVLVFIVGVMIGVI